MKKITSAVVTTTAATAPNSPRRTQTDAQAANTASLAMIGNVWRSLSDDEKQTWVSLSQQLHGSDASGAAIGVQPAVNPYLTFVAANTATYTTSGSVNRQAPAAPIIPDPVPPGLLTCVFHPGSGVTLTLQTAPYASHVIIYAAPPVPAGQNIYKKKGAFKIIGSLPSLTASNNISALYNAKYRVSGLGSKIAIKVVGVSASGTRTAPLFISGITALSAATQEAADSEQTLRAA